MTFHEVGGEVKEFLVTGKYTEQGKRHQKEAETEKSEVEKEEKGKLE